MSATYARVTPSLPCGNPNASRTDERRVQLTRTDGHVDNPVFVLEAQVLQVLHVLTILNCVLGSLYSKFLFSILMVDYSIVP